MQLLGNLPSEHVVNIVHKLRDETDARVILSALQGGMDAKQQPSGQPIAATTTTSMSSDLVAHELGITYPIAYPHLPHITLESLQAGLYHELTVPSSSAAPTNQIEYSPRRRSLSSLMLTSSPPAPQPATSGSDTNPAVNPPLCDARLHQLDIAHWTKVPIKDLAAAQAISLYLRTDHPLLCHFNPDLFISDLISHETNFCSSLLVNSLLFWACVGRPQAVQSTLANARFPLANV
jgi:hypothetical protein